MYAQVVGNAAMSNFNHGNVMMQTTNDSTTG